MKIIKTFESFSNGFDSSIKKEDAKKYNTLLTTMRSKIESIEDEEKFSELEENFEKRLEVYDDEVKDFIIDNIFYNNEEDLSDKLIELGDLVFSKHGTEPKQVLNAIDDVYPILDI